ncbi:MAG: aldehyde dehydrogenase, partial [Alphaproteobacteria bacterium]|nr:aldehyde dehydrogenase [Alphaproteobacteria bacterium]
MSKIRVAINGFGRIGRLVLRAALESGRDDIEFVAVNDLAPAEQNAYLLKYDSVHGNLPMDVQLDGEYIIVGNQKIKCIAERDPSKLPWGELDIDIVMECTGIFTAADKARVHLDAGAKRVLVSAPSAGADKTIVYGVNQDTLTADDKIVSNASCTTNCLAPVAKVLNDNFGIISGWMTTVHAYTGDQQLLDKNHKDFRRARAANLSMIPTSTGAAKAIG